ncbi:MAG: DUF4564 domain-containing protein [Salinivirgaceae bacterium]|nr:DUF4564 domain-containing protein [Salinivirgaceae bacterium]
MNTQESVNKLISYSEKPLSGFAITFDQNKLTILMKPKTVLFGCLLVVFVGLSLGIFFYLDNSPFKYLFAIAPIFIGFISLLHLSKNATKTTFDLTNGYITYENSNFIGKLFNKSMKISTHSIDSIVAEEEKIRNNSSSNNTTSFNYVYKVYLYTQSDIYQIITLNKSVLNKNEVDDIATQITTILNLK